MRNNQGREGNKNEEKKNERRLNDDVAKDWRRGYLGSEFVYQAQTLSCTGEDISKLCHWADEQNATYQRIPRSSTQTDAVVTNAKTADTVLVTTQRANLFTPQDIPDLIYRVSIQAASCIKSYIPCTQSHRNPQTIIVQKRRKQQM